MINNNRKFSIVTVSFNSVKTIEKAILSVLNQTYKNFEYIIIDGGSTDGTLEIINKYKSNFSYFVSEKDSGISEAFNKGIKVSSGEIIGILNSDDWYELDALEIIDKLDAEKDADIFIGALKYWNSEDNISKVIYADRKYKNSITFRMPHLNHPASFFKKKVYDDIGLFDVKYKYAMDYDIFLRAYLKNKKKAFVDQVVSNMLIGGVANKNRRKAYVEVYIISKNKILGLLWFMLSVFRSFLKQ
jgi:glycosyltransferase involved in cell wall biosynthesis